MLACLILCSCGVPGSLETWTGTKQYSGDGAIHTCSNLFAGGYEINFPAFDASRPYSASYQLSHLPTGARERTGITLCFYQRDLALAREKQKSATAIFHLTLRDA